MRIPHLPALQLCLATLMVGGIYVLQNADTYAGKLRDTGHPWAANTAQWLVTAAEYTGLSEFNQAQRIWLDKWLALARTEEESVGHTDTELNEPTEEPPLPEQEYPTEPEPLPPPTPTESQPAPQPAPEPADSPEYQPISDDDTDPLPAPGNNGAQPPDPIWVDVQPSPGSVAAPLPWPTTPAPLPPPAPDMGDSLEPTPPPEPLLDDVSEPEPAPTPEPSEKADADIPPPADTPTPHEAPEQATPRQAPPMRCRIMMMGDSLMEDLGPRLHRRMRHRKGLRFILSAKFSTGLCRPDFFDWPEHMRNAMAEHKPNILVVFIGANDGQPIKHNQSFAPTGGKIWRDTYGQKMQEIFDIAQVHGTKVIWIGLPAIGGRYARLLAETSVAQRETCTQLGIPFVDTRPLFSDENGDFIAFRKNTDGKIVRLRRTDKTHLSPEGNHALIDLLMPELEKHLIQFSAEHPELCLSEEELSKFGVAPLYVTVKYAPGTRKRRKKR